MNDKEVSLLFLEFKEYSVSQHSDKEHVHVLYCDSIPSKVS